jgi:hypothetical protein
MIPILLYTTSNCSFIWKATIGQLKKYASDYTIYWCSDSLPLDIDLPSNFIFIKYDNCLIWSARMKECVELINTDYFIYIQEDWILTDYINKEVLLYLTQFMKNNNIDYLLCYPRDNGTPEMKNQIPIPSIYDGYEFRKIDGHWFQPAIWKKTLFQKIINLDIPGEKAESFVTEQITSKANCYSIIWTKTVDITTKCLYFPHMHAIIKGKWTFAKYGNNLKNLIESYGINTRTRGIDNDWYTWCQ